MLTFYLPWHVSAYGYGFKRIENTLESLQKAVGGYIEVIPLRDNLVMICNEEGKLRNMKYNNFATTLLRAYTYSQDYIAGDALLVSTNGEDFDGFDMKYYKQVMDIIRPRD